MRIRAESLRRAAADNERVRAALKGADFRVMEMPGGRVWLAPQTYVARQCQGAKRVLTVDELQLVLERFRRATRRFAVLVDPDAVVLRD
jgi:hypothetical protein